MEQKIIRVTDKAFGKLESMLEEGWQIKDISATSSRDYTYCYVVLEKAIDE